MNVNIEQEKANRKPDVVKCVCGAKIILIHNVTLMSEAIEDHVEDHKRKIKDRTKAEAEAERIRDDLITKVLQTASQTDVDSPV